MKKRWLLTLCLLLTATASAEDEQRLAWKLAKGDRFSFELNSVMELSGKQEARLEATLTITATPEGGKAEGELRFQKIYTSDGLRSGSNIQTSLFEGKVVSCKLGRNGRLVPNSSELGKLEASFDKLLRGADLKTHFSSLLFELPSKPVKTGTRWTRHHDNCKFDFELAEIKTVEGRRIARITGTPQRAGGDDQASGTLTVLFDLDQGYLTELDQNHQYTKVSGRFIKTRTTSSYTRKLTISKGKADATEKKAPAKAPQLACPKCARNLPAGTKFCPEDGTKIVSSKPPTCPKCGKTLAKDVKFCPEDGTKIEQD